jgi:hypothetical protein
MASRSSRCQLTTPPDRPRHPISRIAHRHPLASVGTLVLGLRCSWCPIGPDAAAARLCDDVWRRLKQTVATKIFCGGAATKSVTTWRGRFRHMSGPRRSAPWSAFCLDPGSAHRASHQSICRRNRAPQSRHGARHPLGISLSPKAAGRWPVFSVTLLLRRQAPVWTIFSRMRAKRSCSVISRPMRSGFLFFSSAIHSLNCTAIRHSIALAAGNRPGDLKPAMIGGPAPIPPEVLEPIRRQRDVDGRAGDRPMAEAAPRRAARPHPRGFFWRVGNV